MPAPDCLYLWNKMKTIRNISVQLMLLLISIAPAFSQGEIADEAQVFFRNERTFSGTLYSSGWGLDYQQANRIDAFRSFTYGGGLSYLKHPKEYKSQSPYTAGWGRSYVFGKLNEGLVLRGGAGFQREVFSKYDKGGIAIRYFYSGGLSLAVLKPIYYLRIVAIDYETGRIIYDPSKFDPDYMQSIYDIYDRESFFMGLNEIKIRPGAFVRAGVSFEYSATETTINALEGGLQLEGFLGKIPIMSGDENRQMLLSLFVTYRFGKVIDRRN